MTGTGGASVKDMKTELEEKTERVVRFLAEEKLGGVLLGGQHNFAWLTGGALPHRAVPSRCTRIHTATSTPRPIQTR